MKVDNKRFDVFQACRELDISIYELLAAPDYLSDSQKIFFIVTMKAAGKALKEHQRRARHLRKRLEFEASLEVVEVDDNGKEA